jgi:fructosamine-3-kinase
VSIGMTDHGVPDFGADLEVLSLEPVSGGFSDAAKYRLRVLLREDGRQVERTLLFKQTSQVEVSALTAAARVSDADAVPELIFTGENRNGPYVVTAFYDADPATDEETLPANAIESLARIHVRYLAEPVPQDVPIVDADWWRAKCAVSHQRLNALDRPVARELSSQVEMFADEAKMINALDTMPRTLIHGDVHRNNVLVDKEGRGHIVDWGGAFVGAPALDIANLGGPSSPGYRAYLAAWQRLTGQSLQDDPGWRQCCLAATVWSNIKYLAFATKIFGDLRGRAMMSAALAALDQL